MPEGVIAGGWPSVIAAYGFTAIVLTFYVWTLIRRTRAATPELNRPASVPAEPPPDPREEPPNDN